MVPLRSMSVWVFGEDGEILADSATQSLILASSVLITGVMAVSPLVADLAGVYGVSSSAAGWLIIGFTAAIAVTLPVVGALADQVGRKSVMVVGLLVFGVAGAAVGAVTRFEFALALRVIQGLGFACASPVILTLFGDMYSGSEETTAQGMRVALNSVVGTLTPLLAGVLFVYSWRFPFGLYLVAVPAAAWVWVAVPPIEVSNDWSVRAYLDNMASFLTNARIALLMVSFGFRFATYYVFLTYISVLATEKAGLAVVAVGALLSLNGVVKTVGSTQAGRLAASFEPTFLCFGSFVLMTAGVAAMGLVPVPAVIVLGVLVFAVGDSVLAPTQKSLVNRLAPAEYRGGANATALTFQNAGKVVGPLVLGTVLPFVDLATAFALVGGLGGALGAVALCLVWLWPASAN